MVVAVVWLPATIIPKASCRISAMSRVSPVTGSFASINRVSKSVRLESFSLTRLSTHCIVSYFVRFRFVR